MKKLVVSLFPLLLCFTSQAEQTTDCLNLHVIENSPLGFTDSTHKTRGVHWDYLTAIAQQTGLCINKELMPYARIWQNIKYGNHDGGIVFKSSSRSELVDYTAFIRTVKTVVIPVNGVSLENPATLENIIIGKTRGTHLGKAFDENKNLKIIELNNYDQAAKMINIGRIDAIAGSALVLSYQLNKHDIIDKVDLENKLVVGEKEQWLQLSKQSRHLDKIELLRQGVEELQVLGKLDEIMTHYYGQQWQDINH
ncbi:substrate-binding periplasmic protein [Thalassotalea sp. PLHSN55]|uniref:substrate-binding periplasmic protein n=1 Tax=Thalassotalea sp. PLHSN55 TaxID=3435888 RepID=UPI003F8763F4